jgi:hypothetical protein
MSEIEIVDAELVDEEPQMIDAQAVRRSEHIGGLRALASFLEQRPDAETGFEQTVYHACANGGEMALLMKRLGGYWEKGVDLQGDFTLTRRFGPLLVYRLYTAREAVCQRVVKGTKQETVEVAADPARKAALEAELAGLETTTKVEHVEDIEWVCPESISALANGTGPPELTP